MPISPARSKPIFSVWSRAKRRTPRPRSRAAPGGYKKSSASSSTSFRPPRNRNQPKPRLRSALVHCKHPLDLTDELAVPGRHAAAEGQHFLARTVDEVFVEIPARPLTGLHRKRCVKGVALPADTPDLANIGKLTP